MSAAHLSLLAHVTWIPMWLFVTTQLISWALVAFWIAQAITREIRMRYSSRSKLKSETLKAQREIHSLATAAFAEMLEEARFGEMPATPTRGARTVAGKDTP